MPVSHWGIYTDINKYPPVCLFISIWYFWPGFERECILKNLYSPKASATFDVIFWDYKNAQSFSLEMQIINVEIKNKDIFIIYFISFTYVF